MVQLDGSPLAERALVPAAELTRRTAAELILARAPNVKPAYATVESAFGPLYPEQAVGRPSGEAKG